MKLKLTSFLLIILTIALTGCTKDTPEQTQDSTPLILSSPAFANNETIPDKYTCQGENINPPLMIINMPEETKTLVLIVDDPDAPNGVWDHWVVWDIDNNPSINENSIPGRQGKNSAGDNNYKGPCPPSGTQHRYFFKLYALDSALDLEEGSTKTKVEKEMKGHILDQTQLIGLYSNIVK